MNQTMSKQVRILAIAPTARGFGYSVMEDGAILECGYKGVRGNKNGKSVFKIEKLMKQSLPDVVVLQDVYAEGCYRAPRIKALHRKIVRLAANHNCKVKLFSVNQLRDALLDDPKGTKHEMAAMLAQRFPAELALKIPRKRRAWENEDGRMDMFDAVGVAAVFWMKRAKRAVQHAGGP